MENNIMITEDTIATIDSSPSSSTTNYPDQITTLLQRYVEEKEAELLAIKVERDEERKKNEELTAEIKTAKEKTDDLVKNYSLAMATFEDRLEKLAKENEEIEKEKEEMRGKLKRLEEELRKEKSLKEQITDEYTESYGRGNSVLMQLVRERVGQMNKTVGVGGGGLRGKMRKMVEVVQLEDEEN